MSNPNFSVTKFLVFLVWVGATIALTFTVAKNKVALKAIEGIGQQWLILATFVVLVVFITAWAMERPGKFSLIAAILALIAAILAVIANWTAFTKWTNQYGLALVGALGYLVITGGLGLWLARVKKINPNNP